MKRYLVTRTTVETFTVSAKDEQDADNQTLTAERRAADGVVGQSVAEYVRVAEMLDTPEYRVEIYSCPDLNFEDLAGDYKNSKEGRAHRERDEYALWGSGGAWGFNVEKRSVVGGNWEHVASCGGFYGVDVTCDGYMMQQALQNVPAGIECDVVDERGNVINTATGTGK